MVKFLRWLKPAVEAGGQTEMTVGEKLLALRKEQPLFKDISFDTIAGYEAHGAIVHYEATPATDAALEPRSEEHTSELQSRQYLVCRLLLEKKRATSHL